MCNIYIYIYIYNYLTYICCFFFGGRGWDGVGVGVGEPGAPNHKFRTESFRRHALGRMKLIIHSSSSRLCQSRGRPVQSRKGTSRSEQSSAGCVAYISLSRPSPRLLYVSDFLRLMRLQLFIRRLNAATVYKSEGHA